MKKKIMRPLQYTALFLASSLLIESTGTAATLDELKQEQQQNESQKGRLHTEIKNKETKVNDIEAAQTKVYDQIKKLDDEILSTNKKVETVVANINETNKEITSLTNSIQILSEKIAERDELLRERARAIQSSGSVSYLDVLLGANSFVDFIDRFSAVNTLIDADKEIMHEQQEDQKALEEDKKSLESKRKELEDDKASLEKLKASLASQKTQKNTLLDELEAKQEQLRSEKVKLEEEYSEALQLSKELQQSIQAEQNRIAELVKKQAASSAASGSGSSSASSSGGALPQVSGGSWTKPTTGRLTSGYGWRDFGGSEYHYGIDIANASGTPVVAAADGIVSYAAPLSTYGNAVIVTHSVGGQIYTSLYAHLSSYNVSVGTKVSKGMQIAKIGTTGRSTGPHLHFEIHAGTWVNQKTGNLNPLKFIPL
ncbi:murein hydrolase activator EnvC family protein [Lysinibacillus sp. 3P01SB]|uniref:murein hydrolase activator EnvC family protein n=1 Tax=Lysinibacillus sp. 3P01SB TaxID=3132284 RepID=UPI0039A4DF78